MKKIIFSLVIALLCSLAGATLQPVGAGPGLDADTALGTVAAALDDCEHMHHGKPAGATGGAHHTTASNHACCVSPGLVQAPFQVRVSSAAQDITPYGVLQSDLGVSYPIFKPPKTAL